MRPFLAPLLLLFAALFTGSCRSTTPPGTLLATSPPGARILVDGRDSGFLTPCVLALDEGDRHSLRFELPGHQPAEFSLTPHTRTEIITWMEGFAPWSQLHFPLFLPFWDLFLPVQMNRALEPSRVHVRMRPVETG